MAGHDDEPTPAGLPATGPSASGRIESPPPAAPPPPPPVPSDGARPDAAAAPPPPIVPAAPPPDAAAIVGTEHRFEFRGNAREYFRIWIVNIALTVLTVGVFSAWAKVRRERWFHGNTWVAGAPFEYLAQPLPILKGRLIAVAVLAVYVLLGNVLPLAQPLLLVALGIATPWLVLAGLRFRARYTAWRTLNFRFTGEIGEALKAWLLMFILMVPTLGLIVPYMKYLQRRFQVEEHRFGGARFAFSAEPGAFYAVYLVGWVIAGVGAFAGGLLGSLMVGGLASRSGGFDADAAQVMTFGVVGLVYAGIFAGWVWIAVGVTNLTFNHAMLGPHAFRSTLRRRDLLWLYLSNTAAILCSLGLLVPWAQVRMARYRAAHLALFARGDLDALRTEDRSRRGATGAETADVFDVDLSL